MAGALLFQSSACSVPMNLWLQALCAAPLSSTALKPNYFTVFSELPITNVSLVASPSFTKSI